ALQAGTLTKFRRQMRSLDMLLIDDIQFLEGKVSSSEEFFHTFNALHNAHKQIVFTADRTPAQLNGLDDRMVSRFGGGLHEELHAPDFETRAAILRTKQEHHKKKLSDDVIYLIARRVRSNIRNLESALTKLVMNMTAFGGEMTVTRAEELLADKFDAEVAQQVNIATIQKQVASYFEIRLGEMLSVKRPRNIAEPRMVAMYLSRQMTDQSLPAIGKSFERNHATVIHAIDRIENKMAKDENFRSIVNQLERQLRS
ncbi:MAG TPA: chromosomal replication initiator protein DnaA, partial [Lentisphaeria bacterium]|nr:chromosomal replication initiator protein DnaA [Lentisphaeria bacterium]